MPNHDLNRFRIIRKPEVLALIGVSSASLHRWVNEGLFPAPVKLGPNSVGWRESAICDWLESREPVGSPPSASLDGSPKDTVDETSPPHGARTVDNVSRNGGRAP